MKILATFLLLIVAANANFNYKRIICRKAMVIAQHTNHWFSEIRPIGFNHQHCLMASLKDDETYLLHLRHKLRQVRNLNHRRKVRRHILLKTVKYALGIVMHSVGRVCLKTVQLTRFSNRALFHHPMRVRTRCQRVYFTNVKQILKRLRKRLRAYRRSNRRKMHLRNILLRVIKKLWSLLCKTIKTTTPRTTTQKITTTTPRTATPLRPITKPRTTTTLRPTTTPRTTEKLTTMPRTTTEKLTTTPRPTTKKLTTPKPRTTIRPLPVSTTPGIILPLDTGKITPKPHNRCPFTDDTHIKRLVDAHNNIREKINDGYNVPSSDVNMPPANPKLANLEWDSKLAKQAQDYVNQCKFKPSSEKSRTSVHGYDKVGENIYYRNLNRCEGCDNLIPTYVSVFYWLSEAKHYGNNGNLCPAMRNLNSLEIDGKYVGNLINMISSSVTKFGCGRSICGCRMLVSCLYGESGHRLNKPVYRFNECNN